MDIFASVEGFELRHQGHVVLHHSAAEPALFLGRGVGSFQQHKGNFTIEDRLQEKVPLTNLTWDETGESLRLRFRGYGGVGIDLVCREEQGRLMVSFDPTPTSGTPAPFNRLWIRVAAATPEECVYGCGEQFSHFNLRGRKFPLWVSEQGVGRNKKTYETFLADAHEGGGGDNYTTYAPQPTFVTSARTFVHVEDSHYMEFDCRHPRYHELAIWGIPERLVFAGADSFPALLEDLTALLGRQPALPDWVFDGVWLGLQGGTETVRQKLARAVDAGIAVSAIWAQDWEGKRVTDFGKQLMWNWKWDRQWYPGLDAQIGEFRAQGVRFLGYINGFLAIEGDLYQEALAGGYLVQSPQGGPYHVVITAFPAAMVDLTNPDAVAWIKGVIRTEMIAFGLSGWMADFGEYLPVDAVLHSGASAEAMHNRWPVLWAQVNREAVEEAGQLGEIVFFTRAGYTGIGRSTTMMWAGDQNVDWSVDDGLPSVITAALSMGMTGVGMHHSDIGGYTTLFHMKRSKELFLRWAEQGAFTLLMRTHEGNRPDDNWQFDGDDETLSRYARISQVHVALKPYLKHTADQVSRFGWPAVRPLFFHYEDDESAYIVQTQYLLGRDLLVAPVVEAGRSDWTVYLPTDEWVHLWTGDAYSGGTVMVQAPLGWPPVFYRKSSPFADLFAGVRAAWGTELAEDA